MPPPPAPSDGLDAPSHWLWLAVSFLPDIVLLVCAAWLWRTMVRTRHEATLRLAVESRGPEAVAARQAAEPSGGSGDRVFTAEPLRLRAILDGMLDPLALLEPVRDDARHVVDFVLVDLNPAACGWFRADRDRLVGTRIRESVHGFESSGLLRGFATLMETGLPLVLDAFPLLMHGASLRRLDVRGMRGEGWISVVWRDVTERHDTLRRLADSEEQFRLLAENSTDVILRLDTNDTILWVSPSVTPVLGWTPAEGVGHDGKEFLATAENREQYAHDKAHVLAGHDAVSRVQVRTRSGDVHWMQFHSFPYRTSAGLVSGMVATLRVIDEQVCVERELEHRANVDVQTGLFTRRALLERLATVVGSEPALGLLWCDIDGFKGINDDFGHAAGDAVLAAIGERIRGSLRSADDIGGRISGDELIVVIRPGGLLDDAVVFAESLRCRAAEPIPAGDHVIRVTISIGVTLAGPGEDVDAVLARADDAMYEAKKRGKNRVIAVPPPATVRAGSRPHRPLRPRSSP